MSDAKGFQNILTNIKTVIGLIIVVIGLITWSLAEHFRNNAQDVLIEHYKEMQTVKFEKFGALLESIDEAVGWNRMYIMNMRLQSKPTAMEIE